ncbi:hypothetical protein NMY22_g11061 [Coprinellus aureogranulatus]|nr:hypothetical protein NMY22_g11061 [Coprinellus aureogranulatus]
MGHGKTRGTPMGVPGRPQEWARWASRVWQGNRRYDKFPSFEPAELAITMCRWWSSIQPSFRSSKSSFPRQIYSSRVVDEGQDVWASLRKSGPNGFVSVLMLMSWLGTAAKSDDSQWSEDVLPSWNRLLDDITRVVDAMNGNVSDPPPNQGVKRSSEKENDAPVPSKRFALFICYRNLALTSLQEA